MKKITIEDIDVYGKRVLARFDFNAPLIDGVIADRTRIVTALPTIKYLLEKGAKLIICSHFGRPKGKRMDEYSLKPIHKMLCDYIGEMPFFDEAIDSGTIEASHKLKNGEAMFLENLRFYAGEEKGCDDFGQKLASLCDVYINDAFGACHRNHASITKTPKFAKESGAGFVLKKEIEALGDNLFGDVARPFLAIVGGSKVSDKIGVLKNLLKKTDVLIVGGGMAFTFLKALGYSVGKSLVEEDKLDVAMSVIKAAKDRGVRLLLPVDVKAAEEFPDPIDKAIEFDNVLIFEIPDDKLGLDIGVGSEAIFSDVIKKAKTILWNGPMGVFENSAFAKGTMAIAGAVAYATDGGAVSVAGGGDSAAAAVQCGVDKRITHISTGGGASLAFLEGKELPGIAALNDKK